MPTEYPPAEAGTSDEMNLPTGGAISAPAEVLSDDQDASREAPNQSPNELDQSKWAEKGFPYPIARELHGSAISLDVASECVDVITEPEKLPESLSWVGDLPYTLPAWLRTFKEADGSKTYQLKPASAIPSRDGSVRKYVAGKGEFAPALPVLRAVEGHKRAVIVEGTKQGMAVMSHLPDEFAIYGLAGISGWMRDGLPCRGLSSGLFKDVDVVVIPDADAATNLAVYEGAEKLGGALLTDGAKSVRYVSLSEAGASGSKGIDDYLGALAPVPAELRGERLLALIDRALTKPAGKKPGPKTVALPESDERVKVDVGDERLGVVNALVGALEARCAGRSLFSSGSAFVTVGHDGPSLRIRRCTEGDLLHSVAESAICYTRGRAGVAYAHPETATMKALSTRHTGFPELDAVSTVPLVRPDGSLVVTNGYDPILKQYLWLDESVVGLNVPDQPTDEDVLRSMSLLRDVLDDFAFRNEGDRASAFALLFTLFLRPLVPLSPLFLLNGLQSGVGKGLLGEVVAAIATGDAAQVQKAPSTDDEMRKVLTSLLLGGSSFIGLDEISTLRSKSLDAFLTARKWTDRRLGVSENVTIRQRATVMGTGNNVVIPGDMIRRTLNVRMQWEAGHPELRAGFKHPKLVQFVQENRRPLLESCLTVIRAYFVRGKPQAEMPLRFGSYEEWQDLIGGVLAVAGVEGFLSNVMDDRYSLDTDERDWENFLLWADTQFSGGPFTARQLVDNMLDASGDCPTPPEFELTHQNAPVALGQMLAREEGRVRGTVRVVKAGERQRAVLWQVEYPQDVEPPVESVQEAPGDSDVESELPPFMQVQQAGTTARIGDLS